MPSKSSFHYKSIKIKLKRILYDDIDYTPLFDAIKKVNRMTIVCYQFIRLYLLYLFENKEEFPIIDPDFVRMAFRALSKKPKGGRKPSEDSNIIYDKLCKFYNDKFVILLYPKFDPKNELSRKKKEIKNIQTKKKELMDIIYNDTKFDSLCLSYILKESGEEMCTCIKNNVKVNFFNYVRRYVNQSFKNEIDEAIKDLKGDKRFEAKKKLKHDLKLIKDDLLNQTETADVKYKQWIEIARDKILPKNIKSIEVDVHANPIKYLKYMITMNKILEDNNKKGFQFCSIRSSIIPKSIRLNTDGLISLFCNSNKAHATVTKYQDITWATYFNVSDQNIKYTGYKFDNEIVTNGYTVSVLFISNDDYNKKINKKNNFANGRRKENLKRKNCTKDEIQNKRIERKDKEIRQKYDDEMNKKKFIKDKKEEFKKMSKEDKEKIKLNLALTDEFPYIEALVRNKETLEILKKCMDDKNIVYGDPGKRSPLYLLGENGEIYNYTNRRRIKETKRLKYQRLRENLKTISYIDNKNMTSIETELADYNSKSCSYETFAKYIEKKTEINNRLFNFYDNEYFRKLEWFAHLNKINHENKLISELKEIFGKDATFIIGDWGKKGGGKMIKYISTPGIGLLRRLAEDFTVRFLMLEI